MNAPESWPGAAALNATALGGRLDELAFALLAGSGGSASDIGSDSAAPEAAWLAAQADRLGADLAAADGLFARWLARPPAGDAALAALAAALGLTAAEALAVALVRAAETDAHAGRALAWLQAPVGGARPTPGLVVQVAQALGAGPSALGDLAAGAARRCGLLRIDDESRPLAEATLSVPQPIVLALATPARLHWPGLSLGDALATPLPPSLRAEAQAQARALAAVTDADPAPTPAGADSAPTPAGADSAPTPAGADSAPTLAGADSAPTPAGAAPWPSAAAQRSGALVVRSGHAREARAAAAEVARCLGASAVFVELGGDAPTAGAEREVPAGLGPWLRLAAAVPVLCLELAPGERRRIAAIPGWAGPVLLATGPDGAIEFDGDTAPAWQVPLPTADERVALWQQQLGRAEAAQALGRRHVHGAGRIAELARAARFHAHRASEAGDGGAAGQEHVVQAARSGSAGDLGALAELLRDAVPDEALVLAPSLRAELEAFATRCLARDAAVSRLGPAAQARFRTGVRALFVGPSGTGKSLAVGWLATRLGLPLFRVDLASVTSKYIGETEKNLAQLFARAERAEVVLMFDEADALFGRRTEVKDSNDRFANAQTNYLLSRIESFEGIAVLTSNSRARFDSAFTRRLDVILEFPPPSPAERRALWLAHLGQAHALADGEVNRLAAGCELAGGHVRNVVLAAAARARQRGEAAAIGLGELLPALAAEYAKLGKPMPAVLQAPP